MKKEKSSPFGLDCFEGKRARSLDFDDDEVFAVGGVVGLFLRANASDGDFVVFDVSDILPTVDGDDGLSIGQLLEIRVGEDYYPVVTVLAIDYFSLDFCREGGVAGDGGKSDSGKKNGDDSEADHGNLHF